VTFVPRTPRPLPQFPRLAKPMGLTAPPPRHRPPRPPLLVSAHAPVRSRMRRSLELREMPRLKAVSSAPRWMGEQKQSQYSRPRAVFESAQPPAPENVKFGRY
jgi:hypothetical protein